MSIFSDWIKKVQEWKFPQVTVLKYHFDDDQRQDPDEMSDHEETMVVDAKFCGQFDDAMIENGKLIVIFKWLAEWDRKKFCWRRVERRRFDFRVNATCEPEDLPYGRLDLETKLKGQNFHLTFWPEIHLAKHDIG